MYSVVPREEYLAIVQSQCKSIPLPVTPRLTAIMYLVECLWWWEGVSRSQLSDADSVTSAMVGGLADHHTFTFSTAFPQLALRTSCPCADVSSCGEQCRQSAPEIICDVGKVQSIFVSSKN